MGLVVKLQTEDGVPLETMDDRRNLLGGTLPDFEDPDYCWANTIDLYADTTFNCLQARKLRDEWVRMLEDAPDADTRQLLIQIDALLERCASGTHLYVKF